MTDTTTFLANFADQFDEADPETITFDSVFREIEGWSSLSALLIIAMIDSEYDVTLTGDNIKNSVTVQDIYNVVNGN